VSEKKIYGIIGHPVKHSLSPAMHNAAFKAEKINAEYQLFDIHPDEPDGFANFCYETDLNNISGLSITMPYKELALEYLDHIDPVAKMIGSVNTIMNEDSQLIGYNTDSLGAIEAIKEKTTLKHKRVLVMGAGGAARAIGYGLKEFGAEVSIFNRTIEKAIELANELKVNSIDYRDIPKEDFDIIINTTPVGSFPNSNESLLHAAQLEGVEVVMDIITNPIETQLIKEAKKTGAHIITGERMLLMQACRQFEIWFNKKAPKDVMEKALYEKLGSV